MLKKFLSAILSAVMVFTLFSGMFTASAAGVKLDDELTAAKKLGFLSASQESRIDKPATQTEVVKMISSAVKKRYGKTGKFLADRKSRAGSNAATRHYYASTLYFAMYEQINSPKYSGYEDYMSSAMNINIMPDAETMGVRKDGSIGALNLFDDCADIDKVRGDVLMPAKYKYWEDYGVDCALVYVCALYDSLTPIWEEEEMWKFTSAIAPINYPEYFKDVWMYICVGALDDTHSPVKMEEFKNKIEALGSDKIVFHRFEDVGHEVPPSWEGNEREQFFEKLLC